MAVIIMTDKDGLQACVNQLSIAPCLRVSSNNSSDIVYTNNDIRLVSMSAQIN